MPSSLPLRRRGGLCGAAQITYGYDDAGRRVSMIDASGTTNYTYDTRDRLLTKATTAAGTLTYTYPMLPATCSLCFVECGWGIDDLHL